MTTYVFLPPEAKPNNDNLESTNIQDISILTPSS